MKGYPKHLNTKEDYIYVKDNFPKEEWEQDWKDLLSTVKDWFFDHDLADDDDGVTDDTHKVVESEMDMDGEKVTKRAQYVLKENPTCIMYQLGFTEAEIMEALA